LNVRVQLVTREGQVVEEHVVDGNVRFIGGNLRATHNLAHNVAVTLKKSPLPEQAAVLPGKETGNKQNQVGTVVRSPAIPIDLNQEKEIGTLQRRSQT
jgi:hypothetical protein